MRAAFPCRHSAVGQMDCAPGGSVGKTTFGNTPNASRSATPKRFRVVGGAAHHLRPTTGSCAPCRTTIKQAAVGHERAIGQPLKLRVERAPARSAAGV